jgi:hypothetical protein
MLQHTKSLAGPIERQLSGKLAGEQAAGARFIQSRTLRRGGLATEGSWANHRICRFEFRGQIDANAAWPSHLKSVKLSALLIAK